MGGDSYGDRWMAMLSLLKFLERGLFTLMPRNQGILVPI